MAETRETQVIEDVINGDEITNPRTTEEAILAKIVAGEQVDINARTRMQYWLSQLKSGGGENPNYVETINGTLANPLGASDYTANDLAELTENNEITMLIYVDGSGTGGPTFLAYLYAFYTPDGGQLNIQIIGGAGDLASMWSCVFYSYDSGSAELRYLMNNEVINISEYCSLVPTILTIIHHPMPEDNSND